MSLTASPGTMLPDFRSPPLVEVIFAVALVPLTVSVVNLARFGIEQLSDEFPIRQDQPPTHMATESFDDSVRNLAPTLALLTEAPPIRLWFQTPDGLWERHGQLEKVLRLVGKAEGFLPEPEDGQVAFRYRISREGTSVGRLYVHAVPGQRKNDREPVIQLTMTARGGPLGQGRDGMLGFFRLAHEWIVNGFAAVTTDEAQSALWGRIR